MGPAEEDTKCGLQAVLDAGRYGHVNMYMYMWLYIYIYIYIYKCMGIIHKYREIESNEVDT